MNSITPIITALEESHRHFNASLFDGKLKSVPVITLIPKGARKNTLGWYARNRWQNKKDSLSELNMTAEEIKRPAKDVLETLIHEMCHQLNHEADVQDCSRSGSYHNKKFRDAALAAGLLLDEKPDKRKGFAYTKLGPRALSSIESILSKVEPVLVLARTLIVKPASVGKMLLFECDCGYKIRSGKRDLDAHCNLCVSDFKCQTPKIKGA